MSETFQMEDVNTEREYVEDKSFTDAEYKEFEEYNENITDFHPLYTNLETLTTRILVRMFKDLPVEEDGIFVPREKLLPVRTKAGHGTWAAIRDPYGFSQRGVVISTMKNEFIDLKKGDEIIISMPLLTVEGSGEEATVSLVNDFVHPESGYFRMPQDPKDPHHGYFLVSVSDLLFKDNK